MANDNRNDRLTPSARVVATKSRLHRASTLAAGFKGSRDLSTLLAGGTFRRAQLRRGHWQPS